MLTHEKLDELRVYFSDTVHLAKAMHFHCAKLRVIAPAALGNVVKQRGDIQHPMLFKLRHKLAAKRVFMRMLRNREAPQDRASCSRSIVVLELVL